KVQTATQEQVARPGRVSLHLLTDRALIGEVQPAPGSGLHLRPGVQVSRNRIPVRVRKQIEAVSLVAAALDDYLGQPGETGSAILLGQSRNLGRDGLLALPDHEAGRGPIDEAEKRQHGNGEQ